MLYVVGEKMKKEILVVDNVSMQFNLSKEKVDHLKEYFIKLIRRELRKDSFWALQNVSFSVSKGDRIGILGLNGAGKSTLLKIIAGVFKPTEGTVKVKGKIVPLLELGAGFEPQYTGRENIYLYGAVLGYSKKFIDQKYEEIVEFSGLQKFIDVPLKNYSSGMAARLGFAIATIVRPEILIVDEVLAVGDIAFQEKCQKRMQEMLANGTTLLYVSHAIETVTQLCDHALWLNKGEMVMQGEANEVCEAYLKSFDNE